MFYCDTGRLVHRGVIVKHGMLSMGWKGSTLPQRSLLLPLCGFPTFKIPIHLSMLGWLLLLLGDAAVLTATPWATGPAEQAGSLARLGWVRRRRLLCDPAIRRSSNVACIKEAQPRTPSAPPPPFPALFLPRGSPAASCFRGLASIALALGGVRADSGRTESQRPLFALYCLFGVCEQREMQQNPLPRRPILTKAPSRG